MDINQEITQLVGQPEGISLEYKAVLPPSRNIAQLISSFANAEGGFIILGVSDLGEVNGLSEDFHANTITHKALDLLSPQPRVQYQYVTVQGKKLYVIKVEKADSIILLEGKTYVREGATSKLLNASEVKFKKNGYKRIKEINDELETSRKDATESKVKLIEHYQNILKLIDDLEDKLYPSDPNTPTENAEGKVLARMLYSSFVDNFETYLSDLLYEIFLARPETLKSTQTVTIEEVLNCSDLQEFVKYWSKQKLHKLQKGSVKGFIKDNKQIRDLNVFDKSMEDEVEKLLQIRHLYSHRNGIVDEKFLQYFRSGYVLNAEHTMSISEICDKLSYLIDIVNQIDGKASAKYKLASAS
ncbi:ATP-binding protein [Phaeodactylibacter sp.]|uniref:AlbA family DNA-binding domain-containing protein n=1 Tax=Phaeodactylibacter sp. TaxID=1940289 RepID=UPI0025CC52B8|nr:ATP-binding protein [Phaeodactylibacter sp.]MCI5091179.1 ATP-binding protein [Phaeodactylibacter sp.]